MIRCVETGRNPTMRYLHRTHRCSVAWLHECFERNDMSLVYELTSLMCADIYTKAFTDASKWQQACWLINIVDPKMLKDFFANAAEQADQDKTTPQQQQQQPQQQHQQRQTGKPVGRKASPPPQSKGGGVPKRPGDPTSAAPAPHFHPDSEHQGAVRAGSVFKLGDHFHDKLLNYVQALEIPGAQRRAGVTHPGMLIELGTSMRKGKAAHVENMRGQADELLAYLNKAVHEHFGDNFYWDSVQVEVGRKAVEQTAANAKDKGLALVLCIGDSSSFDSKHGGLHLDKPGLAGFVGGASRATSESGEPGAVGDKGSCVIKLFQSKWRHTLDHESLDNLRALGFVFDLADQNVKNTKPNYTPESTDKQQQQKTYVDKSGKKYATAALVHCCAEDGNMLSKPILRSDRKVKFVNITKQDDFTTDAAVERVISSIRGPGDMFLYCSPCTGGSTWQHLNLHRAKQDGCDSTVWKLVGHWELHWALWERFEQVVEHCVRVGAAVVLEWPAYNAYWKEPRVAGFLAKHNFQFARFDGCMYGLRAKHDKLQRRIKKPWQIACLSTCKSFSSYSKVFHRIRKFVKHHSGSIQVPSWGNFGSGWAILGPSWGHLGATMGPLWAILGPSWGPLGATSGPPWTITMLLMIIIMVVGSWRT